MTDETSLIPVYIALGGAAVGAIATFFPTYWIESLKEKKEARITTESIVTEIEVSLFLLEKRRYLESVKYLLDRIKSEKIKGSTFRVVVPDEFCIIYKRNIEKIGLLPASIRKDVVTFHQLIEAAVCDVRPGGLMAENECGEEEFQELYDIMLEIQNTGRRIVAHRVKPTCCPQII
jgi:hypothetical protein